MPDYLVVIAPANPWPIDEGMSLEVLLPAENREHAMRRALRYVPRKNNYESSRARPLPWRNRLACWQPLRMP